MDAEDRQRAFNDFVAQLKGAETAHKEEKRRKRCEAFRTLLDEDVSEASSEAYADLKWSSIDSLLRPKNDSRYKDLSSDSRRRTFLDWRDEKIVALGGEPPAREKSRSRSRERSRRDRSRRSRSRDRSRRDDRDRSRRDDRGRRDRSRDQSRRDRR